VLPLVEALREALVGLDGECEELETGFPGEKAILDRFCSARNSVADALRDLAAAQYQCEVAETLTAAVGG
jgi:hypothetical protein